MAPLDSIFLYEVKMKVTARELAEMASAADVKSLVVNGLADMVKQELAASYTPGVLDQIIREEVRRVVAEVVRASIEERMDDLFGDNEE